MMQLPANVSEAWNSKNGPVVFSTVDEKGIPNAIYATCVSKYDENTILIADNYFHKTKKNIFSGSKGSVLFITKENNAFQLKGSIEYHTNGPLFDDMKKWNSEDLPGHAVAALKVDSVYSGSDRLV